MDRSQISPALMKARGTDIAKIPLAAMKTISSPGELGMRLNAYDALVAKARRPHLLPDLVRDYHQLAREVLTTEDRARAVELMKTARVAPNYSPPELQQMLRAGTAIKLDGRIIPAATVRDVRYQVTVAQGALGRGTPEDSSAFRAFLASRARSLGVPSLIPVKWGQPAPQSSAVAAGKSAYEVRVGGRLVDPARVSIRKAAPRAAGAVAKAREAGQQQQATMDHLSRVATAAVEKTAVGLGLQIDEIRVRVRGAHGTIASATGDALTKAAAYEAKAAVVSDPGDRQAYLELARQERARVGAP